MRSRSSCSPRRARSDRRSRPAFDLQIDGQTLTGRAGQTILEVCRDNGIEVPTLCYEPKLPGLRCLPHVRGRGGGRGRAAHQLLARRGAGHGRADPDAAPAPGPQDQPGADLQRPQRLLPAALPEQVPQPHRYPGVPEGEHGRQRSSSRRASSSGPSRSPASSGASAPPRARSTAAGTRWRRPSRSATATATPATRCSRRRRAGMKAPVPFEVQPPSGKRAAVIGSGPGGHVRRVLPRHRGSRRHRLRA